MNKKIKGNIFFIDYLTPIIIAYYGLYNFNFNKNQKYNNNLFNLSFKRHDKRSKNGENRQKHR